MVKLLPQKEFEYIYSKVPRLCVDIIVKENDKILLTKRDIPPAKGMWHIPGGTIIWGESHKEAVRRIAKREFGLDVEIVSPVGIIEYSAEYAYGWSTSIVYLVVVLGGKLKGSSEAKEVGFFKEIPQNIIPDQIGFLKDKFGLQLQA